MCTSWPVTPSSCPTSGSQWPPRAPQAWRWLRHPAPPTAAPQTEPTSLNWLANWIHLKVWDGVGVTPHCVTPSNSIPPCHENAKGKLVRWQQGVGERSRMVWGDARHPSSLSCLSTPAHLSCFLEWVTSFWGSKPWMTHTARGEFWHRVGEKWGSVFGIFLFCFKKKGKKRIKWSIEVLQLGRMERTAEGLIPTHSHTPVHEPFWSKIVWTPLAQTFFISPNLSEGISWGLLLYWTLNIYGTMSSNLLFWEPFPRINSRPEYFATRRDRVAISSTPLPPISSSNSCDQSV